VSLAVVFYLERDELSSEATVVGVTCAYAFVVYLVCLLVLFALSRSSIDCDSFEFFTGMLGHLVGFSVKICAFEILEAYFQRSVGFSFLFVFILFLVATVVVSILKWIRGQTGVDTSDEKENESARLVFFHFLTGKSCSERDLNSNFQKQDEKK